MNELCKDLLLFVFLIGKILHYSWINTNFAKIFAK